MTMLAERSSNELFAAEAKRWQAVVDRDRAADRSFVYSVRTTGVYCRPSCGARLPRRENVAFHASPAAAQAAGFRACRRCQPDIDKAEGAQAKAVARACRAIEEAEEPPSLEMLAKMVGQSPWHFHRVFKTVTGVTPKAYADAHRGQRVRHELKRADTVTQAIYSAGFNSNGRFYAASESLLGMNPTDFREGGTGATIRFALGECSLGAILVAAPTRAFARSRSATMRRLSCAHSRTISRTRSSSAATKISSGSSPRQWDLSKARSRNSPCRSMCAARRSSSACGRLCANPRRQDRELQRVAARIGAPAAVRAVAGACASNGIAVAIPCHRVVRTDGALSVIAGASSASARCCSGRREADG